MDRRGALAALGTTIASLYAAPAFGAVARALTVRDLVKRSTSSLVVTPLAQESSWQVFGGARRIVTDSRARVEELVTGSDPSSSEVVLRTLGGRVGTVGQIVEGEAEVRVGETSLVFLLEVEPLLFAITAMAQGQYPIQNKPSGRVVLRPRQLPALLGHSDAAVERLAGKNLVDALALVRAERP